MGLLAWAVRSSRVALVVGVMAAVTLPAAAQTPSDDLLTGQATQAWQEWQAALDAVRDQDAAAAEQAFTRLLEQDPSPLRIALLEERTTMRTAGGGALLLLEQDYEQDRLGESARTVIELLRDGREQKNQADDGWYFAAIGRFDVSDANFKALLDSAPDPVALLEFSDRLPRRHQILIQLAGHPVMGDSVQKILALLREGERIVKSDPLRIRRNIQRLGGPPRAFENGVALLEDSGEYAIPFLIEALRDPDQHDLMLPILRCLPQIDRPALNPLVAALDMSDDTVKIYLIRALGEIGYPQAVPYLLQLLQSDQTAPDVRMAVNQTLDTLRSRGVVIESDATAVTAFERLAELYYDDHRSLAADTRLSTANVWYWRDGILQNVPVPTEIFNEVMCMRLCEKALLIDSNHKPALALWLAANLRREAQLGDDTDETRPDNFPTGVYFAQSAGAEYCQMVLSRAARNGEPAVALGAITALRKTAGPANLFPGLDQTPPLAAALSFPDRMVRIQAGLALAYARPRETFSGSQNLLPVLSETLSLHAGGRDALVIDPDAASANAIAGALRDDGYAVIIETALLAGLDKARRETPGTDVIFIASDIQNPGLEAGLEALRKEFRFAATPVVVVAKAAERTKVRDLVRGDSRLAEIAAGESAEGILAAAAEVSGAVGAEAVTATRGLGLAKEATEALRLFAISRNPIFDLANVEPALMEAMSTEDAELRIAVAHVLGHLPSAKAQAAMAELALNEETDEAMRVAMFAALAEAAKHHGNLLDEGQVAALIKIAESDSNMVIRTAASQALGALNLPGNPASQIIRNQYQG